MAGVRPRAAEASAWTSVTALVWSSGRQRSTDNCQELPLWLPCRAAVHGGHPREIVLIGVLGPPGMRHTCKVEDACRASRRGVCADWKVS